MAVFYRKSPSRLLARFCFVTRLFYLCFTSFRAASSRRFHPVHIVYSRFIPVSSCAVRLRRPVPFVSCFVVSCAPGVSNPYVSCCRSVMHPLLGVSVAPVPISASSYIVYPAFPFLPSRFLLRLASLIWPFSRSNRSPFHCAWSFRAPNAFSFLPCLSVLDEHLCFLEVC